MLPNLETVLTYQNSAPIRAYMRNYNVDEKIARGLFTEMLKYLWVSTKHGIDQKNNPTDPSLQFSFVMHQEMRDIDNMWHGFILYTHDYSDFCQKYFGTYLHHVPDVAEGDAPENGDFIEEMEKYLSYVYDNLGEKTVNSWFNQGE